MSVPVRACPIRSAGAALALVLVASACGSSYPVPQAVATPRVPGQPAGSVVVAVRADLAGVVQRVQDAIIAGGGAVTTVVDHAADARAVGVEIAPSSVVVGGSPAGHLPLLRADQGAGPNLPQRYLVRGSADGGVTVTYDSAEYVTAVSGVTDTAVREALDASVRAVGSAVAGGPPQAGSSLIGVTPAGHLRTVFGSASVAATVERLRRSADRGPSRSVAVADLSAGSAATGEPVRDTSVVLVRIAEAEAPLLAATPSLGLDLPLRFAVWLDNQSRTLIGYPDVRRIAARHGVAVDDPNIVRLTADADRLARLAAGIIE